MIHIIWIMCYNMYYISYKRKHMKLDELGEEIKVLRKEKGWSQNDLEQYSGITKRTISKIDTGFIDEVGIKKVAFILDLLGYEFCIRERNRPKTLEELQNESK